MLFSRKSIICITTRREITAVSCTWNLQSVTHMLNNDCETRKFKSLTLDNVHALHGENRGSNLNAKTYNFFTINLQYNNTFIFMILNCL